MPWRRACSMVSKPSDKHAASVNATCLAGQSMLGYLGLHAWQGRLPALMCYQTPYPSTVQGCGCSCCHSTGLSLVTDWKQVVAAIVVHSCAQNIAPDASDVIV